MLSKALLANGTFCESLISQFWSNTEDIYKYVPAEESFLIKRSGNRNTAATPSDNRNVSQSLKFWNNGHLPATPTFATPTYHLNTSTGHNTMTNVGPKTKNQDAYKRYCTFSCLRETIDVIRYQHPSYVLVFLSHVKYTKPKNEPWYFPTAISFHLLRQNDQRCQSKKSCGIFLASFSWK